MYAQLIRAGVALGVIITVALATGAVAARGAPAGNAATEWNTIAVDTLINLPGPAGGAPPASQVNMGMVQGAVYDAVNAIEPRHHRPYLLKRRFPARASKEAAVATAAYRVLANIVSTVPRASRSRPGRRVPVARRAVRRLARSDSRRTVQGPGDRRGEGGGRRDDRREAGRRTVRAVPVGAELRARALAAAAEPGRRRSSIQPRGSGRVKPFVMQSSSQFRTAGPAGARQRRLGGGLQRGQGARLGEQRCAHAHPDPHRALVAEHTRSLAGTPSPGISSPVRASTSWTAPDCSRCRT